MKNSKSSRYAKSMRYSKLMKKCNHPLQCTIKACTSPLWSFALWRTHIFYATVAMAMDVAPIPPSHITSGTWLEELAVEEFDKKLWEKGINKYNPYTCKP